MINVGHNLLIAVGLGLISAAVSMGINVVRPRVNHTNPAVSAFLTFVIVFCALMAWDASR
jgi:hypothetical protein